MTHRTLARPQQARTTLDAWLDLAAETEHTDRTGTDLDVTL